MNLKSFNNRSQEHPKVLETLKIIEKLETKINWTGLVGSAQSIFSAACANQCPGHHVFVLDNKEDAAYFLNDLQGLYPNDKLLFGKGSLDPKIVFLSEYPSAEEFQNNTLCVGNANVLIQKIIKAMGITQEDVYFTSIIKSKSVSNILLQKGNNSSELIEKKVFIEYLKKELSLINPSIIISFGELSYTLLVNKSLEKEEFNQIRGQLFKFSEYPVVPTFNPSYLLLKDSLETKRYFWEDLLNVMNELKLEITEKQKNYFKKQ